MQVEVAVNDQVDSSVVYHRVVIYQRWGLAIRTEIRIPLLPVRTLYVGLFSAISRVSGRIEPLTVAEYNAIVWNTIRCVRVVFRDEGFCDCIFRSHMALSDRFSHIDRLYMIAYPETQINRLQRWVRLSLCKKETRRRTALAMALHPRLGGESVVRCLSDELASKLWI